MWVAKLHRCAPRLIYLARDDALMAFHCRDFWTGIDPLGDKNTLGTLRTSGTAAWQRPQ
jgi:hypothetical protein